uniref:Titin n=1 Tax=Chrysemys picta bellii TaxID=8478 RepID=A0A8C3H6I3_CHRPI
MFKATHLTTGVEYQFRVKAQNRYGTGPAISSESVFANYPFKVPGPPGTPQVIAVTKDEPSPTSQFYKACDTVFKPGPPGNPRVLDTSKSSITIAWNKPIYDGGSEITGYMVEIALPEEDEWKIVTPSAGLKATSFTITDLKENQEYKIRIYAMNSEGIGEPALVPGSPKAEERMLPPEIELDAELRKVVNIRACCTLRLFVPIKGRPAPEVKWTREHGESLDKATIESTSSYTLLTVGNVNRFDSGKYILTIENSSVETPESVKVSERPLPPGKITLLDVTRNSVSLSWEKPEHDGGSRILGYIVEMQSKGSEKWATCATVKVTEATITGLIQGEEYSFRVSAQNEKGISDPRQLGIPVVAKDLVIPPAFKLLFTTFSVLAGEDLKVDVPFVGRPKPAVLWHKDHVPLKQTTRVNAESSENSTLLTIKEACKDDVGPYLVKLTNSAGEATETLNIVKCSCHRYFQDVCQSFLDKTILRWR